MEGEKGLWALGLREGVRKAKASVLVREGISVKAARGRGISK